MTSFRRFFALSALTVLLAACAEDEPAPTSSSSSSSSSGSSGTDSGTPAPSDASTGSDTSGGKSVNDCDDFSDRTADGASRDVTWDFTITAAPERCMKVRAGQTVTWSGDLTAHPLNVNGVDAGDVKLVGPGAQVTFTTAGTFGFNCVIHAEMKGAIFVE